MKNERRAKLNVLKAVLVLCTVLGALPAVACFTVLSADDHVVYNSEDAPVDMSRPIHETLPAAFPGAHLVFDVDTMCAPGPSGEKNDAPRFVSAGASTTVRVVSRSEDADLSSLPSANANASPVAGESSAILQASGQ